MSAAFEQRQDGVADLAGEPRPGSHESGKFAVFFEGGASCGESRGVRVRKCVVLLRIRRLCRLVLSQKTGVRVPLGVVEGLAGGKRRRVFLFIGANAPGMLAVSWHRGDTC